MTAEKDHAAQTADVALTPAALSSRKSAASEQSVAGLWAVQFFIVAARIANREHESRCFKAS
jgi:hypothetical protein